MQDRIKDRLGLEEQQARILLRLERWGEAEQAYRWLALSRSTT